MELFEKGLSLVLEGVERPFQMTTGEVSKSDIQKFWSGRVPMVERSTNPKDVDLTYFLRIDKRYLSYNPFLKDIRKEFSRRGKSLIEIGCGAGSDSRAFAALGLSVVSVDLNRKSCEMTLQGYRISVISCNVVQADAENLPFRDNCVDLVYSFGVLHHTPNTEDAVREVHRIVRLAAFVMLYNKNLSYYAKRVRHLRKSQQEIFNMYDYTILSKLYTKAEVRTLFEAFEATKIKSRMFWGGRDSNFLHPLIWFMHLTGLERIYGSFNLIWAEKSRK